jgi:hypothetical protein
MTWRIIIAVTLAGWAVAAYASWVIASQVHAIAAVWTP